ANVFVERLGTNLPPQVRDFLQTEISTRVDGLILDVAKPLATQLGLEQAVNAFGARLSVTLSQISSATGLQNVSSTAFSIASLVAAQLRAPPEVQLAISLASAIA